MAPNSGTMTVVGPVMDMASRRSRARAQMPKGFGWVVRMAMDQMLLKKVWPKNAKAANSWITRVGL